MRLDVVISKSRRIGANVDIFFLSFEGLGSFHSTCFPFPLHFWYFLIASSKNVLPLRTVEVGDATVRFVHQGRTSMMVIVNAARPYKATWKSKMISISVLYIKKYIHTHLEFRIIDKYVCIYIYIHLEPICPLFLGLNPSKEGLFKSKQGSFGFQVYIYILYTSPSHCFALALFLSLRCSCCSLSLSLPIFSLSFLLTCCYMTLCTHTHILYLDRYNYFL